MTAEEFVRSLYLGDRACKSITIDGWNAAVRLQVDVISRVRSPSGEWSHYTAEDVADGSIVFEGVTFLELNNASRIPNELINSVQATAASGEEVAVTVSIDSVAGDASCHETFLSLRCRTVHIEDPARPGLRITE